MARNRVASFFQAEPSDLRDRPSTQGFALNPFAASLAPWQIEIYQAAFRKAHKDLRDPWDERPPIDYQI